jgi:hypothetical protein
LSPSIESSDDCSKGGVVKTGGYSFSHDAVFYFGFPDSPVLSDVIKTVLFEMFDNQV